tara:strand:- start:23320 stop:23742 length:423 start_codon:yes stop_codon:yes gene_type:complete
MKEIIGFDSNILVYAFNADEKDKHKKAFDLINNVSNREIKGFLSIQNLNELFYVLTNKKIKEVKEAEKIVQSILNSDRWIIKSITKETTNLAIELSKNNKGHYWDNLIAANLILNGVTKIYTENVKDFKSDIIKPINPFN